MTALDRQTGGALAATSSAHLIQSIGDILTTPIGSRIMRRAYGSILPDLIDQPLNPATRLKIFAATAMALLRWEPRCRLKRVQLEAGANGVARLRLDLIRTDLPRAPAATVFIPLAA